MNPVVKQGDIIRVTQSVDDGPDWFFLNKELIVLCDPDPVTSEFGAVTDLGQIGEGTIDLSVSESGLVYEVVRAGREEELVELRKALEKV